MGVVGDGLQVTGDQERLTAGTAVNAVAAAFPVTCHPSPAVAVTCLSCYLSATNLHPRPARLLW